MRSDKLIQLDRELPPSCDTRDEEHAELRRQMEEFLARGGKIDTVEYQRNYDAQQPIKRTRKMQVEWQRKNGRIQNG